MQRYLVFASLIILAHSIVALGDEPNQQPPVAMTRATYLITGLHCPPCTRAVESSLQKVKGVRAVKVDWKAKSAQIEFDEALLPAQRLAQAIAGTPHMMGGNMRYGGWLALRVPDLKDAASATAVKASLTKITGVKQVAAYPDRQVVSVQFGSEGEVTSGQLIEALGDAGFHSRQF